MQLILSPSKTQQFSGRNYPVATRPPLMELTALVREKLKELDADQLTALMKTSSKLTQQTLQKIQNLTDSVTKENAHQAIFTFQGDVYDPIQADEYNKEELEYAQNHLFILSALYGMLRPLDLMQPYRLEMAAKLKVDSCETLYQFWKPSLTESMNKALHKDPDPTLVNLASLEYFKVLDKKKIEGKVLNITFKQMSKGKLKTIAIHSKRARGQMVDFAIRNKLVNATELKHFTTDGYVYSEESSTEFDYHFLQKEKLI